MGATRRLSAIALCLALAFGLAGIVAPASAQQQEKRVALVVGNGAYTKSPLATAANDAGLIAQTLQAAGFDVVGARDLDGDTLRRTLRDFIQKVETSGPDTVAMIYLAGYGMQLAGENYFVPVDSAIGRETDIPTEGLRVGDYVRRLGSLPLKASIVVLDAARQQPFVEGGQPIAGGLALVEPEPRMLIAFNAAPGTVAPDEQGPYGAYAQSLAEMIRTGGLPLPELFDRVRLRVNENTRGAEVPWHAQKLDTNFVFFDRAPDAPAPAPPDQAADIRNRPIRDLGVRDAYAAAVERDTLQGYDEFVAAYPGDPLSRRVRALAAARREAITWMRTYRSDTPQAYWSYLRRYPNGPHAADARRRLAILTAPIEPPPAFAVIDYDVPPPPPEEIVYVDRPVVVFSDPYYDFAPPPPPPVYFLPPPPPDFVVLEPPPPPIGLFILPQPLFVPIPVYVRPPIYVAAPPNNIIYANIHNTTVINNVINRPPPPQPGPGGMRAPGDPGRAAFAAPGAGSPALPPSVAQRASLIREGKAPVPPSASINPAVRPAVPSGPAGAATALQPANAGQPVPRANTLPGTKGAPGPAGATTAVQPANAPPVTPQSQPLPRANALPVPGAKGAPPAPTGAATGAAVNPNARTTTPSTPQTGTPAPGSPAATTAAKPLPANAPPVAGTPQPTGSPGGAGPPPRPGAVSALPPPPASNVGKPPSGVTSAPTPPPGAQPAVRTPPPSAPRIATPSPPPRVSAPPPPPPPRVSAPPPPAPRMAAPSPPPPRVSAPPPPPPQRMAAPPPPPRMAAPAPPPRPVAPPPAAAKRCPPNVPRC